MKLRETGAAKPTAVGFPRPSPLEWVCLAGGLFLTIHYAWFLDDAFVYFRYADNLLHLGRGLVFNAGEYVEGFSSPLWMLLLIVLRWTGLNFWIITRLVGAISFAAFWFLLVTLNRRLSPRDGAVLNLPLCYLSFTYGVSCYFTSGLESPLVQVAAPLYAMFVLRPNTKWLQLLLAATPLLRHEFAVPLAMCLIWAWARNRRLPWLMTITGISITGSWVLFRIYYYADLFPNTFYLKDTVDFSQGLVYLQDTGGTYWLWPLLIALMVMTVFVLIRPPKKPVEQATSRGRNKRKRKQKRRRSDRTEATVRSRRQESGAAVPQPFGARHWPLELDARLMMIALALSITLYVTKIGGDPRHYRYLAFPFCLMICSCSGIVEHVLRRFSAGRLRFTAMLLGLCIITRTVTFYPQQLMNHPFGGMDGIENLPTPEFMKIRHNYYRKVNKIADAGAHRHNPTLAQPAWGLSENIEMKDRYREFRQQHPVTDHVGVADRSSWCAYMYRRFDLRFVHSLGLTDPVLARVDVPPDRPAHKEGLFPLAGDIGAILRKSGNAPHRGMFQEKVDTGA
ncbi:MAG: hypothetical protein IID40_08765, partial [Planctomycetes bacterium]|nr:hypothetical protein [Planctomycetota bacterium]